MVRPSPRTQNIREKYLRLKYGRWWWAYYHRLLPSRLPWTLVALLSFLLAWCLLKSL
jgi:hypothetical protein